MLLGKPRDAWRELICCAELPEVKAAVAELKEEVEQCEVNLEAFGEDEYERDLYEASEVLELWESRELELEYGW